MDGPARLVTLGSLSTSVSAECAIFYILESLVTGL